MNFDLSEEQEMLRDSAARFVREEYGFEHRRRLAASAEGFSRECWRQYADLGWLALNLSDDVGGLGCSFVETLVLAEQFGRGIVLEPFVTTSVLCAGLVDLSGSEWHRQALLPAVAAGELLMALAIDDAGASNPAKVQELRTGDGFRLDAVKTLVLDAPSADRYLVTALFDGVPAIFVVPKDAAGLTLAPYSLLSGMRAADIRFDGVVLEPSALLARGTIVEDILAEALDRARLAFMAAAVGSMEACMEVSSDYIKQRSQFGQPLSKFQALQHLLADMFVDTQQSRSILYYALSCIGQPAERRGRAVAAAKIAIGGATKRVPGTGIQLHGGYGTTDEYPVSHHYRQLFVLDRLLGSADEHLRHFAPQAD
jgi:alkylation response protein AidB-like acyl-CoA dehydrogenase